jgi:hypothetical protein
MKYIDTLAAAVVDLWSATHFDPAAFPEVAYQALTEHPASPHFTSQHIIDWVADSPELPRQPYLNSTFGQPPVTVFCHPRFYIEALFWTTGTTSIHQHGFAGAFTVLEGSSLESNYTFEETRRINVNMLVGDLRLANASYLRAGHVEPIIPGKGMIHSVFHLDLPSVTLVVRTETDIESQPQYDYLPPFLAVHARHADPVAIRRVQVLELLAKLGSPRYEETATRMLSTADPYCSYHILRSALMTVPDRSVFKRLVDVTSQRYGELGRAFGAVVKEFARQRSLVALRAMVGDPEARFLLALLLAVPSQRAVLQCLAERFPLEEPVAKFLQLFSQITQVRPDLCGVKSDSVILSLLADLLHGSQAEAAVDHAVGEFPSESRQSIQQRWQRASESALLGGLFQGTAGLLQGSASPAWSHV